MAITRSLLQKQLNPGLNEVLGLAYGEVKDEHKDIFEIVNSDKATEQETMMSTFGSAPVKSEGAGVQFDEAKEVWTSHYTHETIALAFAITEEAVEDNLYESTTMMQAKGLGRSMANTKETKAAAILNNATNSAYTGGDGQPLISAAHPTVSGGNQSNSAGSVDLSETNLETAFTDISLFKDDRGILIGAQARKLVVPPANQFTAAKILNSTLSTTTATNSTTGITNVNDKNILSEQRYFPQGYVVNHRLTDTNAWYILTDVPNGLKMFVRSPLQTKMDEDFISGNMLYKARERYSFGWSNWRGIYASDGSS